jgi:hypothetical protein
MPPMLSHKLVGVVLIMGFVSEFNSLATFAGFVTAGIAVLLSIAAYFFVVGRYGIASVIASALPA